jgi:hypothetical protein
MESSLSTVQVKSEQSTLHTEHNLKKKIKIKFKSPSPPPTPHKKKKEKRPFTPWHVTSHWLHGKTIPKIGCLYFWPELIVLPKTTLTISIHNLVSLSLVQAAAKTFVLDQM